MVTSFHQSIYLQVKSKVFKKSILPSVEKRFTEGWGNCSPDTLLLLMYSYRHHKVRAYCFFFATPTSGMVGCRDLVFCPIIHALACITINHPGVNPAVWVC